MSSLNWGGLDPQRVSQWINFERNNPSWQYQAGDGSMAAKQTEGVAYLWNLLSTKGVALLADEVGMGKTFQALGVAALLWKLKPDARVLVMAPGRDICRHWRREFETFVRVHYRDADHSVKNIVDGGPVPSVQQCYRLGDLVSAVERRAGHLYLTTIHALSGLVPSELKSEGPRAARMAAEGIHQRLKAALGEGGFDLIIVDEAHYLRNLNGGSQRVSAARALFGAEGNRLGAKNLLMTATPSHTRLIDVQSILSYFTETDPTGELASLNDSAKTRALLQTYALRRLRLMEGVGGLHGKHHYRHEKALAAGFEGRPNAEMFFALYQKRLVADLRKHKENKSLMYGYLEGFESIGHQPEVSHSDEAEGSDDNLGEDFSKASDTELLRELTRDYLKQFGTFPDHPKYGALIDQCVPKDLHASDSVLHDHKHLVFVRRIPSVRELTQRVNARYDELLAEIILRAWGIPMDDVRVDVWRRTGWSRKGFEQLTAGLNPAHAMDDAVEVVDGDADSDEESGQLASRIAELFVVKKGQGGQTDCANVRLRFSKPESVFALFLEPASDYLEAGYTGYYAQTDTKKADYANAARFLRFQHGGNQAQFKAAVGDRFVLDGSFDQPMFSVWSLLVPKLPAALREKLAHWAQSDKAVAENFANYLKAGFLHASPVIVELYGWFVEFQRGERDRDAQRWYRSFYAWVSRKIAGSLMLRYFIAALETFDHLCGKIIDHGLDRWDQEWRSLKGLTSPCWYASGENGNSRQRLILGFNSPFYPNVLVTTSVLQEGVNLHMQCHQIHHYGLAGSPGDNEQRIGRLDRLFGCVNQRLKRAGNTDLSIHYPFLQRSVDEDQVASFVERKYRVEEQMDACVQAHFDKEVQLSNTQEWKQFLRTPIDHGHTAINDPYGACFEQGEKVSRYEPCAMHTEHEVTALLESYLQKVIDPSQESFECIDNGHGTPRTLFLIDPLVEQASGRRRQPIFVNLAYAAEFSALVPETAYLLTLASPISNKMSLTEYCRNQADALARLEDFVEGLRTRYPLVRLTINENADNSYFYLCASVDLPLLVKHGQLEMLSLHEVEMAFYDLKHFADDLETALYGASQDLSRHDLQSECQANVGARLFSAAGRQVSDELIWRDAGGVHGGVASLSQLLPASAPEKAARSTELELTATSQFFRLLQLNHHFPFVTFLKEGDAYRLVLNYPKDDLQPEERQLLERWFRYLLAVCR